MSQQGGMRRSVKLATALLVAVVVALGIAGLANASNIQVSNTAQLQNALSSPTACTTTIGPCPDTTPGASNTITLTSSTDPNHQYQPTAPLNLTTAFAGTSLTIVGPQVADANGFGAIVSGQNVICPCPVQFGNPDLFDVQAGTTVVLRNLDIRNATSAGTSGNCGKGSGYRTG